MILKFEKKTKVDKQIDEMQLSISSEIERAIRLLNVNDNMLKAEYFTKAERVAIHNNNQHAMFILKNLASDLKSDARL